MPQYLANENVPRRAIEAARTAGIDIVAIREFAAGIDDEDVLDRACAASQVLVTFDKDFGELAFRRGRKATHGVILLRPRLRSPGFLANFLIKILTQPIEWRGNFAVADEGQIRVVELPK